MEIKKLAVTAAALALAFSLSGCTSEPDGSSSEEPGRPAEVTTRSDDSGSVKLKNYTEPTFLQELPAADVLSDVSERSFDTASILTEPEKQPFEGYKCTGLFGDMCYIFKEEDGYGLLSLGGEVLLEPEGIVKITAVGTSLLSVRYEDGSRTFYRVDENGIYETEIGSFDKSRITFEEVGEENGDSDANTHYTVLVDRAEVCSKQWLSWEETPCETLDTEQRYEAVYYAQNAEGGFYLAFDSLYNLTIYRAERGYVEIRAGDIYGSFYITDPDELTDLQTLIDSFGDDLSGGTPKGEGSSDYVRVVIGRQQDGDRSVYTISPDGYCLTELFRTDSSKRDGTRYFRKLSGDTFSDLVYWAEKVCTEE